METLKVTKVQVQVLREPKGKLFGFARITLNNQLWLTGLRIYIGGNGLFVSYPLDKEYKGEDYKQLFFPITKTLREEIERAVLEKYNEEVTK